MKISDEKLKLMVNEPLTLERGTRVRLLSGGNRSPLSGFDNGSVYVVTHPHYEWSAYGDGVKIEIVKPSGYQGYADRDQLEVVRDE